MRPWLLVLLATPALSCGRARDPSFFRIVQFSAVDKLEPADSWVYFAEEPGLKRVEKAGNATVQLVFAGKLNGFAAVSGHVYVATPEGVMHVVVASNGVIATPVPLSADAALAVAADPYGVSWVSCTELTHAALDGTRQVKAAVAGPCAGSSTRLVLDSSTAYGINGRGEWYASRAGGPPTPFANEPCKQIAVAGGWLYCANGPQGLTRFSPVRKDVEQVLQGDVHAFAVGDARIYAGVGVDLVAVPRNSTQVEVLGTYAAISAIGLDGQNVFFVNTEGSLGLLLRTAL